MQDLFIKELNRENLKDILVLTSQLNKSMEQEVLMKRHIEMLTFDNYKCFGLFDHSKLVGVSSGWISVKIYSGKQIEIDNFVIDSSIQSKGYGTKFIELIEAWAVENQCKTIELNTYVQNSRSHKFYFNRGFSILGYHFHKSLEMI